jgi:hypothetical protein
MQKIMIATLLLPFACAMANAQAPRVQMSEPGPIVLRLPGSARALAMGGAYPGFGPDADAIFYNPALLQSVTGLSTAAQLYGSSSRLYTFSGANGTGFGVGVQFLDYQVFGPGSSIGSPFGLSDDAGSGTAGQGEFNATLGYMRPFFGRLRVGVAAKWARHLGDDESAGIAAFDLGSSYNPFNWLNLSLSVQNVAGSLKLDATEYDPPTRVALHATTRTTTMGPLDLSLAGRVNGGPDEDVSGGLGAEVSYWPFSGLTFALRGGARIGTGKYDALHLAEPIEEMPFTLGGGVSWGRVSLDYALDPYRNAADAHRIGLRVR